MDGYDQQDVSERQGRGINYEFGMRIDHLKFFLKRSI